MLLLFPAVFLHVCVSVCEACVCTGDWWVALPPCVWSSLVRDLCRVAWAYSVWEKLNSHFPTAGVLAGCAQAHVFHCMCMRVAYVCVCVYVWMHVCVCTWLGMGGRAGWGVSKGKWQIGDWLGSELMHRADQTRPVSLSHPSLSLLCALVSFYLPIWLHFRVFLPLFPSAWHSQASSDLGKPLHSIYVL